MMMITVGMNTDTGLSLREEKGDEVLEIDQDQEIVVLIGALGINYQVV